MKHEKACTSESLLVLLLILIGYKVYYELFKPIVLEKSKQTEIAFDTQANISLIWHLQCCNGNLNTFKQDVKSSSKYEIAKHRILYTLNALEITPK